MTRFLKKQNHFLFVSSLGAGSLCLCILSAVLYSACAVDISPLEPFRDPFSILKLLYNDTIIPGEYAFDPTDDLAPVRSQLLPHSTPGSFLSRVPPHSVTAILPIVTGSLDRMPELLEPFLYPLEHVNELVIICPDAIVSDVRRMLQKAFSFLGLDDHPDVSLQPWKGYIDPAIPALRTVADVSGWALVMDETGLSDLPQYMRDILLSPPNITLPFGPRGILHTQSPSNSSLDIIRPATLYPPFVVFAPLLGQLGDHIYEPLNTWDNLGVLISESRPDRIGGILMDWDREMEYTSSFAGSSESNIDAGILSINDPECNSTDAEQPSLAPGRPGNFIFMIPTRDDLRSVAPLICRMKSRQTELQIRVLVYAEQCDKPDLLDLYLAWETEIFGTYRCDIEHDISTNGDMVFSRNGSPVITKWLADSGSVNVVFTLSEQDSLVNFLLSTQGKGVLHGATHIRIPRSDLPNTEWMSALSLEEWISWHRPRIDLSIITKDRPAALTRLLRSLENASYFGDQLLLRVNVEQDCDEESLRIVENITWAFGRVFVHHRVVHAGLLPAVVEAWYPQNDDSYGLLLEDDIEVSPLFYAWLKMSILRYRYGDPHNRTPNLFGISLYQQKNLELPIEGRQAFNPRTLFSKMGMPHPHIPYLSAVPCSWGAVYFPEHWREFHRYIIGRLGEITLTIDDQVVPEVRSNFWAKSWKKYFIELVYLRGYVMLYPNYEDFVSLSTNHLEVGSHVKDRSAEKRDMFLLPLMKLHKPQESMKLLDLPHGQLPDLNALPVLNLTGHIVSLDILINQGLARQNELAISCGTYDSYSERSLMCLSSTIVSGIYR